MRPVAFAVFLVILVSIHFLLHVGFGLGQSAPDLVAVAALLAARRTSATKAAGLGVLLGILDDAMGIGQLGARSVALAVSAVLGTLSRNIVEGDGPLFVVVYLFAGKWAADILLTVITPATAMPGVITLVTWTPIIAAYTALTGVLAFTVFRALMGPDA